MRRFAYLQRRLPWSRAMGFEQSCSAILRFSSSGGSTDALAIAAELP